MNEATYIVVGCKSWSRRLYQEQLSRIPGTWHFIAEKDGVTPEHIRTLKPRYLFFLHWSWKVPAEIVRDFECVCFHMTDVPYGRGGSPLQNLILRGHRETKLTALRMTEAFDAGPVYAKAPLSLEGTAEEILLRGTALSGEMIKNLVREQPTPTPQTGTPVIFKRRRPVESEIPPRDSLADLHDFIRMLDGEGYPPAFISHRGFRYEFSRATLREGRIVADVTITPETNPPANPVA